MGAGPLETNTVTGLPTCTIVPAAGSVLITRPAATVELACELVAGLNPAARRCASACEAGSPSTLTRGMLAGPPEITTFTRAPLATRDPGGGLSRTTRPAGTVALGASEGIGVRPARLRIAPAACSVCPVTSGTVTFEAGERSSRASTAATTTSAASSTSSQRLRRGPSGGAAPSST
jgi:hypothetical protein